jgi:hypothetical protein
VKIRKVKYIERRKKREESKKKKESREKKMFYHRVVCQSITNRNTKLANQSKARVIARRE